MSARILVVDDQETNRRLLHARLASEYYQVQLASSGQEALDRVKTDMPDIILLDVMMPGIDGYEVCRRLKHDALTRHIPVLMITALDERDARLKALEAGAEDYLTKPIDEVQLMARLRNVMRMKPVLDELRAREASGRRIGLIAAEAEADRGEGARILVINEDVNEVGRIKAALGGAHDLFGLEAGVTSAATAPTACRSSPISAPRKPRAGSPCSRSPTRTISPAPCVRSISAPTIWCCAHSTKKNWPRACAR